MPDGFAPTGLTPGVIADMAPAQPASPGLAHAEPDLEVRKGGGMTGDGRIEIPYRDLPRMREAGVDLHRYAIMYYGPTKQGPGTDRSVGLLMPAEKEHKWFGQGYRPVDFEPVEPPEPTFWQQSMVESAIANGDPIPEEMAPKGYFGPTFSGKELHAAQQAAAPATASTAPPLQAVPSPSASPPPPEGEGTSSVPLAQIFTCRHDSCERFFDSENGRKGHEAKCELRVTKTERE